MNSFGRIFKLSIFGESHGPGIGVTIDGCPPGIALSAEDFEVDLARRRSGTKGTTSRSETDTPTFLSGTFNSLSTGAPLTLFFKNQDIDSSSYEKMKQTPRPGHADFVAHKKYLGFNDYRGSGHFSGRLTVALVAAGVIAKKIIAPIQIQAHVTEVGGSPDIDAQVAEALANKDSVGGLVECEASKIPVGLGEPFFDSLEALIAHLAFSIPAIKGIEFGSGFAAARMSGSAHNDPITSATGTTSSNHAGGINGGISNGNNLVFRVAVKPASSIGTSQQTIDLQTGKPSELSVTGRHDACLALRVPPVIEAVTAIALADLLQISKSV